MKKLLILFALLAVTKISAQEAPQFTVLERMNKSNKTYYKKVYLDDLESADSFDGKHFKIVKGKSKEAIKFNEEDVSLLLKAANTYYHLTKAKKFWTEYLKIQNSEEMPKLVVRLEITNVYDELGHFAHDNRTPQYNNALSIPAGETPDWVPSERQDKWEKEIWFRPMKKIDTKTIADDLGDNPLTQALRTVEGPFINYTQNRFNQTLLEHLFYPNYVSRPIHMDIIRFVGTIAITKAIIEASKHMDNLFLERWYYLDTSMVPEIIYHEYAHIILSDYLAMSHSTPVVEGMADYFAALMADKKRIYAPVRGFSNSRPKDPNNRRTYSHWDESNQMATADFTLSVLWDVKDALGEEYASKVIFNARTYLKTETATINEHLLRAILESCHTHCESPRRDKFKLFEVFSKKGF